MTTIKRVTEWHYHKVVLGPGGRYTTPVCDPKEVERIHREPKQIGVRVSGYIANATLGQEVLIGCSSTRKGSHRPIR